MYQFKTLETEIKKRVLFATVNNPPVNVMSLKVVAELTALAEQAAFDDAVGVIVLQSGDPDFFLVHFDTPVVMHTIGDDPQAKIPKTWDISILHRMCVRFRDNPKPSLVKIGGRLGGGGSEVASSCDMRFGVRGKTQLNQMEVPLGIYPAGSGSVNLPRLLGRGRALEVILGAEDIDADTLEKWGYLNRVFDDVEAMSEFVDNLAYRIAKWPPHAVAAAKEVVNLSDRDWHQAVLDEARLFDKALENPITKHLLSSFMARGAHTREGENRMGELCVEVADSEFGKPPST